jgi:hypothetical protein
MSRAAVLVWIQVIDTPQSQNADNAESARNAIMHVKYALEKGYKSYLFRTCSYKPFYFILSRFL